MKPKLIIILLLCIIILILLIVNKKKHLEGFKSDTKFILDKNNKLKINDKCSFSGYGFNKDHEKGECSVAIQVIPKVNNVLEIGGGAGKVSHMINTLLKNENKTRHIVVEPGLGGKGNHGDIKLWENKKKFNDKYTIVKKYANDLTMEDLEVLKGHPECLYVDCEGCLKDFCYTKLGKYVLKHVKFIVNEMDGNNEELRKIWKDNNFSKVGVGYGCGVKCDTEIWERNN